MLKEEFERLVGRSVTLEQYQTIETLYMNCDLDKHDFVKSIRPIIKALPQPQKRLYFMVVHNTYGDCKTPNGAYYLTVKVTIEKVDVKKGVVHLRKVPNSFEMVGYIDDEISFNDWQSGIIIDE